MKLLVALAVCLAAYGFFVTCLVLFLQPDDDGEDR